MFKSTILSKSPSTRAFLRLWTERYQLDASRLMHSCSESELADAISSKGRKQTATNARRWIKTSSELAGLKTNSLFSYVPNVVSVEETKQIAVFVERIYDQLLQNYQRQPMSLDWIISSNIPEQSNRSTANLEQTNADKLLAIEELASAVEPLILELQSKHKACQDRRTIGFMSTQFHFSTQVLTDNLKPVEKILLKPYLRFVEEQVCIPWQRVCAAVKDHFVNDATLKIVRAMLPQSDDIAHEVYDQALSYFPSHRSRRGLLSEPVVTASFIRDMNMFQAYLWLCVLEGNMSSIEDELLPLCIMVFPAVSVDWTMTEVAVELINASIQQRLNAPYLALVQPYMQSMKQLFTEARSAPDFVEACP